MEKEKDMIENEEIVNSPDIETKPNHKLRKVVIGGTVIAVLVGTAFYAGGNYKLDKGDDKEVEQPVEEEIAEFDINDKEQLKLAVEFFVEESAAKGFQVTAEEALDFLLVKNIVDLDAEKLSYLYSSKRATNTIFKNFSKVGSLLAVDAFTAKDSNDFVDLSRISNNVNDKESLKKIQTLNAELTTAWMSQDEKAVEKAVADLKAFINDLYFNESNKHLELTSPANLIIIKQLIVGFTLDSSIMDVQSRIAMYGTEDCELKEGSILDYHMKESEKDLIAKYAMMQSYAIASGLESEYEDFIAELESIIVANVISDTVNIQQMKEIQWKKEGVELDKDGEPKTKVIVEKKVTTPAIGTPATDPKKLEEAKTALSEKDAKEAAKIIEYTHERAQLDAKNDYEFMSGDINYYAKKPKKSFYTYDTTKNANDSEYLKLYIANYSTPYENAALAIATKSGYIIGNELATIYFNNNKTFDINVAAKEALQSRQELISDVKFYNEFKASLNKSFTEQHAYLVTTKAANAALGIDTKVTMTGSNGEKEIYNEGNSTYIVTHENTINYNTDKVYDETDTVVVKNTAGELVMFTLAEARAAGYKSIYRMVNDNLTEFPLPEKGKTK